MNADKFIITAMKHTNSTDTASVSPRVFLILPAFNEEECLPSMFSRLAKLPRLGSGLEVLVVDDGSSDDTAKIAMAGHPDLSVRLIQHFQNRGLGKAMQTGIQQASRLAGPEDVIIAMDADDTHDVGLMAKMLDEIASGADVVIASRFVDGGDDTSAPPFRRLLSRGASVVFNTLIRVDGVKDFTCGYRAYRASLLQNASRHWGDRLVEEQGFACMVEILLKLRFWNPDTREIPMTLRYDRKMSVSKLRLFKTIGQYIKLCLRDRVTPEPCETPVRVYNSKTDTIEVQPSIQDAAVHA